MAKTIISDAYRGEFLRLRQALQSTDCIQDNIRIQPLTSFLSENTDSQEVFILQLRRNLLPKKEQFPIYGDMFVYPSFFQEILSFAKNCILYDVPVEALPHNTDSEIELQKIVEMCLSLPLEEKQMKKNEERVITTLSNQPDTYLLPCFSNVYKNTLFEKLQTSLPLYSSEEVHPVSSLHHALNIRQEIESIAQDICKQNEKCMVIMTSPGKQFPVIEEVFARYHIPFSSTSFSKLDHVTNSFIALCKVGIQKDVPSLLQAISTNAFSYTCPTNAYTYLREVMVDLQALEDVSKMIEQSTFSKQASLFHDRYEQACQYYENIKPQLDTLLVSVTPQEILQSAFNIIRENPNLKNKSEITRVSILRRKLTNVLSILQNTDELSFYLAMLENTQYSGRILETDFCLVTDIRHPLFASTNAYVVGCNGTDYPGFTPLSGIFDEAYVRNIPQYPAMRTRHALHMQQLSWLTQSATNHIYYSYALSDYEGRELQVAYELEVQFGKEDTPWSLDSLKPYVQPVHHISNGVAEPLYLKNDTITGSVSTIERYFHCPYSWFLESGLKLRVPDDLQLSDATYGTLQHAFFEYVVKKYGKDYTTVSEDEIRAFTEENIALLQKIHPHDETILNVSKERLIHALQAAITFLHDFESYTSFVPKELEHRFREPITDHVILNGIIDRYDTYNDEMIRIVDYKSSSKNLELPKLEAGTQLQLLTYMWIATKLTGAEPAGAYYYSLQEKNISLDAAKGAGRGKNKEIVRNLFTEDDIRKEKMKAQMLSGWTFTDRKTELDSEGNHIKALKTTIDYEERIQILLNIYNYFYEHIKAGDIFLDPDQDACTYCKFHAICKFHGEKRNKALTAQEEDNGTA